MAFEDYYSVNPIGIIDQNTWTDKEALVNEQFLTLPTFYTPMIEWIDRSQTTGAQYSRFTELLEGDTDVTELAFTDQYIAEPLGVDSRERQITVKRYGDKVQLLESSNIFQQWNLSGQRDWRPVLRGVLGRNVQKKIELVSRNSFMLGPKSYWTYGGDATSIATLDGGDKFGIEMINEWNLRLGSLGAPVVPGDIASAKLAIIPPGCTYDFFESLHTAGNNEAALWKDASLYQGKLKYEIGTYKNIRFVEVPNDKYGQNLAVLYNAGAVDTQAAATIAINMGDGSPDPESTKVDEVWYVGQKDRTHSVTCAAQDITGFNVNDIVAIHTARSSAYGDPQGVDFLHGKTIQRRIISVNDSTKAIQFDRPILFNYIASATLTPKGNGTVTGFAYITKATHIGFILVLGAKGGIKANLNRPLKFYNPKPVDDFESVWRWVWDIIAGWNVWEPSLFECHFVAVTLPKPGGIISPPAESS